MTASLEKDLMSSCPEPPISCASDGLCVCSLVILVVLRVCVRPASAFKMCV